MRSPKNLTFSRDLRFGGRHSLRECYPACWRSRNSITTLARLAPSFCQVMDLHREKVQRHSHQNSIVHRDLSGVRYHVGNTSCEGVRLLHGRHTTRRLLLNFQPFLLLSCLLSLSASQYCWARHLDENTHTFCRFQTVSKLEILLGFQVLPSRYPYGNVPLGIIHARVAFLCFLRFLLGQ